MKRKPAEVPIAKVDRQAAQQVVDRFRSEYLSEREQFFRAEQLAVQEYDKAIMTLSSSLLGISISLVGLLDREYEAYHTLICAWVSFAGAIVATLSSLYFSHSAFRKERDILDCKYKIGSQNILKTLGYSDEAEELNEGEQVSKNSATTATHHTTWMAGVLFVIGIALLVVFGVINVRKVAEMKREHVSVGHVTGTSTKTISSTVEKGLKPATSPAPPIVISPDDSGK